MVMLTDKMFIVIPNLTYPFIYTTLQWRLGEVVTWGTVTNLSNIRVLS